MNAEQLRQMQAPVKEKYRADPSAAKKVLCVIGTLNTDRLTCSMPTWAGRLEAGLHAAAGGDGSMACSGDMLLESLVACTGVTLSTVAIALGIQLRGGTVTAEGDLDFRGTLGVSKDVEIGFKEIRLKFDIDTDASAEQVQTLLKLTERYCVIYQTLRTPPVMSHSVAVNKHN